MSATVLTPPLEVQASARCTRTRLGALRNLDRFEMLLTRYDRKMRGKVFLKESLGLTGIELSVTELPAGASTPVVHSHKLHEELYLFLGGRGQMQVDGELFEVEEGSAVRVATAGHRAIRAAAGQPLTFICVQAREGTMPVDEAYTDGVPEGKPSWPE